MKFLKKKKFAPIRISLLFYDLPNQSIRKLGDENVNFAGEYQRRAKYWLTIAPEEEKDIHSYKDIKQELREVSNIKKGY